MMVIEPANGIDRSFAIHESREARNARFRALTGTAEALVGVFRFRSLLRTTTDARLP
jgi:hypothetical protein